MCIKDGRMLARIAIFCGLKVRRVNFTLESILADTAGSGE